MLKYIETSLKNMHIRTDVPKDFANFTISSVKHQDFAKQSRVTSKR